MRRDAVLRTEGLGKRFRRRWALRDCSMELPRGRIAALVGPNAAGKTTLLKLATGLIAPTEGAIVALGVAPGRHGTPAGLSFMAQEKPLYRTFRVAEMLRAGAVLNAGARWDAAYARRLVDDAGIAPDARISTLSGGQRSRVALALALGRRPELLLVDEPLADLDPLARRQVTSTLLAEVVETGMTVLLTSHVIAELEGICDHLLLMRGGRVELAGDIDDLLDDHHLITGLIDGPVPGRLVHERCTGRQRTALVRGPVDRGPGFAVAQPTLEELVLAHLEAPAEHEEVPRMIWLVWRRQRAAVLVAVGVLAVVAVILVAGRLYFTAVAAQLGVSSCLAPRATPCEGVAWGEFSQRVDFVVPLALTLPLVLPGALGIILGAGLFGRDLERGTHVFALTQSAARLRWWATGLLTLGGPAALLMAALTPVLEWVRQPVLVILFASPLQSPLFETTGALLAGYTVLGFAVASMAGLLSRNVLAAVVVAVVAQVVVQGVLGFGGRNQYLPPERAVVTASEAGAEGGFGPVPEGAITVQYGYLDSAGREMSPRDLGDCGNVTYTECLQAAGVVRTYVDYQPASRFWPFQGIEAAILLVLVGGTLGAGVWALRSRVG